MTKKINTEEWSFDEKAKSLSFFSLNKQVSISREMLDSLKELTEKNGRVNARFCLHGSPEENLQDMVILEYKEQKCKKPHKHTDSYEAIHLIEGRILSLIFDDAGELVDKRYLDMDGEFIYRNSKNMHHLYFPIDGYAIFREIRDGKFDMSTTVTPDWDYTEILKEHLSEKDMECYNASCKEPCSLSQL